MEKKLLKSIEDFRDFIKENTGMLGFYGYTTTHLDEKDDGCHPEKYPCIAVWEIIEHNNGPAHLCAEFVYPDDFNE